MCGKRRNANFRQPFRGKFYRTVRHFAPRGRLTDLRPGLVRLERCFALLRVFSSFVSEHTKDFLILLNYFKQEFQLFKAEKMKGKEIRYNEMKQYSYCSFTLLSKMTRHSTAHVAIPVKNKIACKCIWSSVWPYDRNALQ